MLLPIPGFSYLKTTQPSTPPTTFRLSQTTPITTAVPREIIAEAHRRMRILLDIVFGVRPPSHVEKAGLSAVAIRLLRRRISCRNHRTGPVKITSIHLREAVDGPDYEIYGGCSTAAQGWAFLARFGPPSDLPEIFDPRKQARDPSPIPAFHDPRLWQIHSFRLISP